MSQVRFLELFVTPTRSIHQEFTDIVRRLCLVARCSPQLFVFHGSLLQLQGHLHDQSQRYRHRPLGSYTELHHLHRLAFHRKVCSNHHSHGCSFVKKLHICLSCTFRVCFKLAGKRVHSGLLGFLTAEKLFSPSSRLFQSSLFLHSGRRRG
jgi:hypothetical protein